VEANLCSFFQPFIDVGDPIIKRERFGILFTGCIALCCWVGPKSGSKCSTPYIVVGFVFNYLSAEVIVRLIDIDRIVDNHCLNFSFVGSYF